MLWKPLAALALAFAVAVSGAHAQDAKADSASKNFIKKAIESNYAEINVGKLAQEKGNGEGVKRFGAMLVKDHSAANEKAIAAAKEMGVEPPSGSSIMEKGTYLKLKVLSGDTFDKSFAKGMVEDHKSDIKEFEQEASKTDPAGRFAKEALPTLRNHLQEAQSLASQTTGSK